MVHCSTSCRAARLLQFAESLFELIFRQLQPPRGLFLVAVALAQRLEQHNPLDLGQHRAERLAIAHARGQVDLGSS